MKLIHLKINGEYYYPVEAGVQDPKLIEGCFFPVCRIKKLWFGMWRVDYYDRYAETSWTHGQDYPNTRIIIHQSKIEEIRYDLKNRK